MTVLTAAPLPAFPADLTPDALTPIISALHPGVRVETAEILEVHGYGEVNVSTSARVSLNLSYGAGAPDNLPTRVIAKMQLTESIWCGKLYALFQNEVEFYNRIRPELDIETPRALGGSFDAASSRYILLLEDISTKNPHFCSQLDTVGVVEVQALLKILARLHARYWESPRFTDDLSWVQTQTEGSVEELLQGLSRQGTQAELAEHKYKRAFLEQLGMTEEEIFRSMIAMKRNRASMPQTLLHGDTHFGNSYRLPDGQAGLYDWQVFLRGFCMQDVSYAIVTALGIDQRRAHERELITFYRECLIAEGVMTPPSMDMLWLEHRRAMLWAFYLGWLPCPTENYGWELTVLALQRTSAAALDLDSRDALRDL